MERKESYFGYSKEEILINYNEPDYMPNLDERVCPDSTLSQLADVSRKWCVKILNL